MKMKNYYFLCFILLSYAASCTLIGDSAFKIKGVILYPVTADHDFYIDIYLAKDNKLLRSRKISNNFYTSFTISPKVDKYFIVIRTDDGTLKYKSKVYELGKIEYYENPIDLGDIILKEGE